MATKKKTQRKHAVEKHLASLEKDMKTFTNGFKQKRVKQEPIIHKQRLLWVLMVIIPAIIIAFMTILIIQSNRMLDMKAEMLAMGEEIGELRQQNAFYRKAYAQTLDDVRVLAEAFGGDERYELLSEELRKNEIEIVLNVTDGTVYGLRNEDIWDLYIEEGMVNQSCLTLVEADTIARTTMLSMSTKGEGKYGVYVDGNFIQDVTVDKPTTSRVSIELEEKEHEIDFVLKKGNVELEEFLFDLVDIPVENGTFDAGKGRAGYDCKEISEAKLAEEGNLRFFVHKQ